MLIGTLTKTFCLPLSIQVHDGDKEICSWEGQFSGLFYHFWTKAVPKLDRYRRKDSPNPFSLVKDTAERVRIIQALKPTEGYVLLASIAIGTIQMLNLKCGDRLSVSSSRYLRTFSNQIMSEASMSKYLGEHSMWQRRGLQQAPTL